MHEGTDGPAGVRRIVFCHLESVAGLPALNEVFETLGDRIGLVLVSHRFGGKHGGVFRQWIRGVRRSGLRLTLWLGFDIVCARALGVVARARGRDGTERLRTVRESAARHGARLLEVDDVNAPETVAAVREYRPDLMIVMNFDQILQAELIGVPRLGVLNLHPSLLPALRGPCPAFWALAEGRRTSGYSIHLIEDERIDAGRVIACGEAGVDSSQCAAEVTTRLFLEGARALPEAVAALEKGSSVDTVAPAPAASYRSFPTRSEMAASRRVGVRLVRARHLGRLLRAALTGRGPFGPRGVR